MMSSYTVSHKSLRGGARTFAAPVALVSTLLLASALHAAPTLDEGRVFEDFPFKSASTKSPAALAVSFSLDFTNPVRAVTLHLKSGDGWYTADLSKFAPDLSRPVSLRIPLSNFVPQDSPGKIEKASDIRLSAWMTAPVTGMIALASATFTPPATVAIVRATATSAPGETGMAAAMAARAEALLTTAGIDYDVIPDDIRYATLKPFRTILLPYSPRLPKKAVSALEGFVKEGGRLVVFFNATPELARAMGLAPGRWRQENFPWTAIELKSDFGDERRFPYYTEGAIPPAPASPSAKVAGVLVDADGRHTQVPAIVTSPAGAWFASIPPRAYPAAADTIATIVTGDAARAKTRQRKLARFPAGKAVAAWQTSPFPRRPGGWKAAARELSDLGVNTLFLHLQAADTPLKVPGSRGLRNLDDAIAACRENDIALHAWVTCLTLDQVPASRRRELSAHRTLEANRNWLDPSSAKNRADLVDSFLSLARKGVNGIHLDYMRMPDSVDRTPEAAEAITRLVAEASEALRRETPGVALSVAVYPTPEAAARRSQDWPSWVEDGLVDFVTPMIYTASPSTFQSQLDACLAVAPADKVMPGIGTGADECQVGPDVADAEIAMCAKCRGFAFFALDDALLELLEEE